MTGLQVINHLKRGLPILAAVVSVSSLASQARTQYPHNGYRGPGRYEIAVAASDKLLSMDERSQRTVLQWSATHGNNQRWDIEDAGDGYVYIRSAENGLAMDIEDRDVRNGSHVVVSRPGRVDSQLWRITQVDDDRVNIISRVGWTLNVPKGSRDNGVQMDVWTLRDGGANGDQRFRLIWIGGPAGMPFGNRSEGHDRDGRDARDARDERDEKSWYDVGYSAGVQDFTAHLRRSYARHRGEYSREGEEGFIEGYYDGYEAGRGDRGRMRDQDRGDFDAGFRFGQQDQREGRRPNYMRYSARFDERSESDFRRGYEGGYYSTR
jgi:Ricin-type beta-trefoil lectin domain-like